nr:ORF93 [Acipenserid herpesvirus 1]
MNGHLVLLSAFAKKFYCQRRSFDTKPVGFVVINKPLYDPEWERRCYVIYTGLTAAAEGTIGAPVCDRLKPFKGCVTYNAYYYVCLVIKECQRLLVAENQKMHPLLLQYNPLAPLTSHPPIYVSCVSMAYICNLWATLLKNQPSLKEKKAWRKIYNAYEGFVLDHILV